MLTNWSVVVTEIIQGMQNFSDWDKHMFCKTQFEKTCKFICDAEFKHFTLTSVLTDPWK